MLSVMTRKAKQLSINNRHDAKDATNIVAFDIFRGDLGVVAV